MKLNIYLAIEVSLLVAACGGGDDDACTPLADYLISAGQAPHSRPLPVDALARGEWHQPFLLVWKDPDCRLCSLPTIEGPYYDPAALPANVCKETP